MKKLLRLLLFISAGLLSCNAGIENTACPTTVPETTDSLKRTPREFKLTDLNETYHPGDYYLSTAITYSFSGRGDENSMDETPYLNESSKPILDSVVIFLKRNSTLKIRIHFASRELGPTYDSCVDCAFEETIKSYFTSKGIKDDRLACSYNGISSQDQKNYLNKIRTAQPRANISNEFVLLAIL
jgi:hypothetical protein